MTLLANSIKKIYLDQDFVEAEIQKIKALVLNCFPVAQIVVFGSSARAEAKVGSDVDLLVVFAVQDQLKEMRRKILTSVRHTALPI